MSERRKGTDTLAATTKGNGIKQEVGRAERQDGGGAPMQKRPKRSNTALHEEAPGTRAAPCDKQEHATKQEQEEGLVADAVGSDGPGVAMRPWPSVSRESTYEHLNSVVPDELKYASCGQG